MAERLQALEKIRLRRREQTPRRLKPVTRASHEAHNLRNWGPYSTRELVLEFARAVDESGLDTVWINERLAWSPPVPEVTTGRTLDPLATLAFLAAATRRVGLGTAVLNLPFRPALPTAKWVATVQDLSGGRVRLGVGACAFLLFPV